MIIRRFCPEKDLQKLEAYLRERYYRNRNMASWLPERLHDLIYRMSAQESDGGGERSIMPRALSQKTLWGFITRSFDGCLKGVNRNV